MEGASVPFQEAAASAPSAPHIETEPHDWQPKALWVGGRQLAGAAAFFFLAFVFAYFYLRSLDVNKSWKIGAVNPGIGLGVAIIVVLIVSAAALRVAAAQPERAVGPGAAALGLCLLSIVLQVVQWTTLGFGPASGGFASVYIGWTGTYAVFSLMCAYWIETQVATAWRAGREGIWEDDGDVMRAGLEACSFFWTFYVAIGVIAFVLLYLL